ncbi:MAG: hypothetical protein VX038_01270 [Verrucomicrobiota bacterium]|nr:hypothetical protein [Verrucomicrobiota bacterium]
MFNGLGSTLRFHGKRINFEDRMNWALNFLGKEDRVIWYLGILQRAAILQKHQKGQCNSSTLRKKLFRILKNYSAERICEDYLFQFREGWEHLRNVQETYLNHAMLNYSFYEDEKNRSLSKTPSRILRDYRRMEQHIESKLKGERHCNDGSPFIRLEDGWVWFVVEEGRSRQEGSAMRHCGNGFGHFRDQLLSLREPVKKGKFKLWKPHLTFILNDGYLGEMKGYANSKPKKELHGYIASLLEDSRVLGIKGGGYLARSNFCFSDLCIPLRKQVLEINDRLDYDPIGISNDRIEVIKRQGAWYRTAKPKNRSVVETKSPTWGKARSRWLFFQSKLQTDHSTYRVSEAWCTENSGRFGPIHFEKEYSSTDSPKVEALLKNQVCVSTQEDLLDPNSSWGRVLTKNSLQNLIFEKPSLFKSSSIEKIFEFSGCSTVFSRFLNQRYGLNTVPSSNGIVLQNYSSIEEFGKSSGVGWLVRLIEKSTISAKVFSEFDFLELGWLVLRRGIKGPSLYLLREGVIHFFKTMDLDNQPVGSTLLSEIVLRFGPPDRKNFIAGLGLS